MSTADVNDRISTAMLHAIVGGEMRAHRYLTVRQDRAVWLSIIAIAGMILRGLMAAGCAYCRWQGGWPALSMPSWTTGGVWKLYCEN